VSYATVAQYIVMEYNVTIMYKKFFLPHIYSSQCAVLAHGFYSVKGQKEKEIRF
jgi:hypothetical protein